MARSQVRAVAGPALALVMATAGGCQRPDCTAPADVSGDWIGTAHISSGARYQFLLTFTQSGDTITGGYAVEGASRRELFGVRIDRRVEFDTESWGCGARMRGVARFCGESLDLTLDGADCDRPYHGTATLRRTSSIPTFPASGGTAQGGAGTGSTHAGATAPRTAGTGGSAPAPCSYAGDGRCDEPEGSGHCEEGQDPEDCAPIATCNGVMCPLPDSLRERLPEASNFLIRTCCADSGRCGYAALGGACTELTSGRPNAFCHEKFRGLIGPSSGLEGCCRTDGACGVGEADSFYGFICSIPNGAGTEGLPRYACDPLAPSDDMDGGAP